MGRRFDRRFWALSAAVIYGSVSIPATVNALVAQIPGASAPGDRVTRIAPQLDATVRLDGRFIGFTFDGHTVIEAKKTVEEAANILKGIPGVRNIRLEPDAPVDALNDLLVFYTDAGRPRVGDVVDGFSVVDRYDRRGFVVLRSRAPITAAQLRTLTANPAVTFVQPRYVYRLADAPVEPAQNVPTPQPTASLVLPTSSPMACPTMIATSSVEPTPAAGSPAPSPAGTPNDPDYLNGALPGLKQINAPAAWASVHDADVTVAVIDTGVHFCHEDLGSNMWRNPNEGEAPDGVDDEKDPGHANGFVDDIHGYDFLANDGDPRDTSQHGTRVAGVIGAVGNNGLGIVGVAWRLRILAVRIVEQPGGSTTSDIIAKALDYAMDQGARVINLSWTSPEASDLGVEMAIKDALDRKIFIVTAAGNSGKAAARDIDDAAGIKLYPIAYEYENIIGVMGVRADDHPADLSNWGKKSVDIAAPVDAHTTSLNKTYADDGGTSFATAYVSGALALVLTKWPNLNVSEVRKKMQDGVDPCGDKLKDLCAWGGRLDLRFLQ